ncbi:MAG: MFS transporter [Gammaproteobacteria bacterium]
MSAANNTVPSSRIVTMLALIAAGEAAFFLPFLVARVFRPTVLDVFDLTNLQLGTAYGVYGAVAMVAYLLGGPLADRFPARLLLTIALVTTAAGGLVLITIPSLQTLILLYGCWGITTIALFWAPLIRATREWGGELAQGAAFGLLDGGRGLLAAITGSVLVITFAMLMPVDPETATATEREAALRVAIGILLLITTLTGLFIWLALPTQTRQTHAASRGVNFRTIFTAMQLPAVWLQAMIIICAYVGFRAVDDFPLYATEVLGVDEVAAARLSTVSLWVRPFAAIAAGLLADRITSSRMTLLSFGLILFGSAVLASGVMQADLYLFFLLTMVTTSAGVFALRGLYYAIMQQGRIPLTITGSAVGVVSLIGYTPDVFMGPLMGWLLDRSPGAAGHQDVFIVVCCFALAGCVASIMFERITRST